MKLEFSRQIFGKILKHQISWKSVQLEPSCSMRTDGRTDMTKLIVAFRNCASVPTNHYVPTALTDRSLYTGTDCVFCEVWTVFVGLCRLQIWQNLQIFKLHLIRLNKTRDSIIVVHPQRTATKFPFRHLINQPLTVLAVYCLH